MINFVFNFVFWRTSFKENSDVNKYQSSGVAERNLAGCYPGFTQPLLHKQLHFSVELTQPRHQMNEESIPPILPSPPAKILLASEVRWVKIRNRAFEGILPLPLRLIWGLSQCLLGTWKKHSFLPRYYHFNSFIVCCWSEVCLMDISIRVFFSWLLALRTVRSYLNQLPFHTQVAYHGGL